MTIRLVRAFDLYSATHAHHVDAEPLLLVPAYLVLQALDVIRQVSSKRVAGGTVSLITKVQNSVVKMKSWGSSLSLSLLFVAQRASYRPPALLLLFTSLHQSSVLRV